MIVIQYMNQFLHSYPMSSPSFPEPTSLLFTITHKPYTGRLSNIYVNPITKEKPPLHLSNIGYVIITKVVNNKDLKDVVLNLRHEIEDVRILCEEIISNGYERITVI